MSPERVEVGRSGSNGARPRTESKRVSSILVGSSSNPLWSQLESRASDVGRSGSDPYMEGDLVRGAPRSWIASSKVRRHRPMHVPVHRRRLDHRRRRRPRPCRAGRRLSSRQKRMATLQIIPAGVRCLCSLGEVHKPGWGPRGHQHDRLVARFENIDEGRLVNVGWRRRSMMAQ